MPSVSIVGSGRLGTALAIAMSSAGYEIRSLVARRLSRARKAAALLGQPVFAIAENKLDQLQPSEVVIIATPDDRIESVVQGLEKLRSLPEYPMAVLHTSGALSSDVLAPLSKKGCIIGSLHPLVSISEPISGATALRGAFFCVEGERKAVEIGAALVRELEGQTFTISAADKPLYHAAAVIASGHVVALFDIALDMLVRCGLEKKEARRILMPLLQSTVGNLSTAMPSQALTGTFRRADIATMKRHLEALAALQEEDVLAIYSQLGSWSLKLASEEGADPGALRRMNAILIKNLEPGRRSELGANRKSKGMRSSRNVRTPRKRLVKKS